LALIARSFGNSIMAGYFVASRAEYSMWITIVFQPFKASIIVGEFLFKVLFGINCFFNHLNHLLLSYLYKNSTINSTCCQGITYKDFIKNLGGKNE